MSARAGIAAATLAALLGIAPGAAAQGTPPQPIPEGPDAGTLPVFVGSPAVPDPVHAPDPPRHPFMAPNGRSNLHDDAYMTDTHPASGPLGRDMERLSTLQSAVCGSVTFDGAGRIVTICIGLEGPRLVMLDARTLEQLAAMTLPPRMPGPPGSGTVFNDFAGGGYFYLDQLDRAVIPTTTRHIYVVRETAEPGFEIERDFDLNRAVAAPDKIVSALPDWSGRIWFVSVTGVVGTIDPGTGEVRSLPLGEDVANSFAVDETGGVYIVSEKALYRFDAAPDGTPAVTWREAYENSGVAKPGQVHAGSGTTPTLMGAEHVSITDNADPMNVVVYRREREVGGRRLVCAQPVFEKGASATDNSLIATERSMVVENNYGYSGPAATQGGGTTAPGVQRVDIERGGEGCRTVWRSEERAPTVVPKLSLRNGLVYTYTKDSRPDDVDAWHLTAIDFRTGRTVFKRLAGEGLGHNNNYAPVTIGPDGSLYVGALGGLILLRDGTPPGEAAPRAPRLSLRLRRLGRGRLRAAVTGADAGLVERVELFAGRRRLASDGRPPFRFRLARRRLGRARSVRAVVLLRDGRRLTYRRRLRGRPR